MEYDFGLGMIEHCADISYGPSPNDLGFVCTHTAQDEGSQEEIEDDLPPSLKILCEDD